MENNLDYHDYDDDDHYLPEPEDIAVSVFLFLGIFAIILGFIILIFNRKRWNIKHVPSPMKSLLFADTLQLFISPFILETMLTGVPCWHASWWCITVYILFSVSRFCGLFFHLLVALKKINSLRSSPVVSLQSNQDSSMFLVLSVWFLYICVTSFGHVYDNYLLFYSLNIVFGVVVLFTAAATCSLALKPSNSPRTKCQRLNVLSVAMFTFAILYVPEFLYWIIQHHSPALTEGFSYVVHYLPCLRPITDCVLCWFVCMDRKLTDVEPNKPMLNSSSATSPSQNALENDCGEAPPIYENEESRKDTLR